LLDDCLTRSDERLEGRRVRHQRDGRAAARATQRDLLAADRLPVDLGHSRRDDDGVASGRDSAGCPVVRVEPQAYRVRNSGLSAHHYRQPRPQELGWTEGRNIQIDIRWAGADANKARTFAKELVAITPDVILHRSLASPALTSDGVRMRTIDFYDMKIASGHLSDNRPRSRRQHKQLKGAYRSRKGIMYRFATILIAGIVAAVLGSSAAFMPTPARAAKLSNAERIALEKATAACKAEAKGMKFSWHWRKRQKYVQNCIIRSASRQGIDIWQVRSRANMGGLPIQDLDDLTFVFSRPRR
jgi:hypothetical protein